MQHFCHLFWRGDRLGRVAPGAVDAAITDATLLVSVMTANNEIGSVQPVREIGAACAYIVSAGFMTGANLSINGGLHMH